MCSLSPWSATIDLGSVVQPSGGNASIFESDGASPGYIDASVPLRGAWNGFISGGDAASLSYEACLGTTAYGCQVDGFKSVNAAVGVVEWALGSALPLQCGATHYMLVRATNCAGLQHVVASNGTKLCCSAPVQGKLEVLDASGNLVRYVSRASVVTVRWSGFEDACSGLRSYTVQLRSEESGSVVWESSGLAVQGETSLAVPETALGNVSHGEAYVASVLTTSHSGRSAEATVRLVADLTPPEVLSVRDGPLEYDAGCGAADQPFPCSWEGVLDEDSGLSLVQWALGSRSPCAPPHNTTPSHPPHHSTLSPHNATQQHSATQRNAT
jgi:hypothetical protein